MAHRPTNAHLDRYTSLATIRHDAAKRDLEAQASREAGYRTLEIVLCALIAGMVLASFL